SARRSGPQPWDAHFTHLALPVNHFLQTSFKSVINRRDFGNQALSDANNLNLKPPLRRLKHTVFPLERRAFYGSLRAMQALLEN
ncbi:hypothetical protein, partial [Simiduia aestuariiviva]|uniref:hypothetical protein n=1 Tax=Simiduia aestuariiviva TaxID=1510459 RepID=UPI001C84C46F